MGMKEFSFDDFCRFFQSVAAADFNKVWPMAVEVLGILGTLIVQDWAGKSLHVRPEQQHQLQRTLIKRDCAKRAPLAGAVSAGEALLMVDWVKSMMMTW